MEIVGDLHAEGNRIRQALRGPELDAHRAARRALGNPRDQITFRRHNQIRFSGPEAHLRPVMISTAKTSARDRHFAAGDGGCGLYLFDSRITWQIWPNP